MQRPLAVEMWNKKTIMYISIIFLAAPKHLPLLLSFTS